MDCCWQSLGADPLDVVNVENTKIIAAVPHE